MVVHRRAREPPAATDTRSHPVAVRRVATPNGVQRGAPAPARRLHRAFAMTSKRVEHFDVLIVGAGISGVGGAYHLKQQCPGTSFVVLDALESYGGTWLTHRYPGTRSDSDLYTFGYRFKPWTSAPIATRAEILTYLAEVIEENGLAAHIRYGNRVLRAAWS